MSLSIPLFAAGLWLAVAQPAAAQPAPVAPSPMPPSPMPRERAERPAPAGTGKCMWERFPQPTREAVLARPTLEAAYDELRAQADAFGATALSAAGEACGVGDGQFRSAGARVSGWVGRSWAEKQLAGRVTPQQLDQAFRAIPAADRKVLLDGFVAKTIGGPPAKPLFDRYLAALRIGRGEEAAFTAATTYLVTRLQHQDDDPPGR